MLKQPPLSSLPFLWLFGLSATKRGYGGVEVATLTAVSQFAFSFDPNQVHTMSILSRAGGCCSHLHVCCSRSPCTHANLGGNTSSYLWGRYPSGRQQRSCPAGAHTLYRLLEQKCWCTLLDITSNDRQGNLAKYVALTDLVCVRSGIKPQSPASLCRGFSSTLLSSFMRNLCWEVCIKGKHTFSFHFKSINNIYRKYFWTKYQNPSDFQW